ncbi:uroporphyrinogen-III synthase [Helicobacter turcicus]|uniref:Uroporphyrinogen-III synthase n=1 Tax=Helicobacter turcicus TaxID=2867412 RepID=A0ABS7JLJ3_9HELI|nr:uroporphyrinogen-III synthase [Helicobacter turcicus]MBX7490262.1 uroporphyrinogen-III synthase [Helicobacter turcicus]MBX7545159.1 uroporphyrinogen-III synthase [Helicobacter turcicus]
MIYYITKTNPDLTYFPFDERVWILPLITLQTQFAKDIEQKLKASDSLIFTSKNAIYAFNENLESLDNGTALKELWARLPNFVIGQGSANALKDLGIEASFIASSAYGEIFAQELIPHLKKKNPLFLRAKKIASKLPEILRENGIALEEVIVYKNTPNFLENPPKLQKDSIIIFSAPSHIKAFLLNFRWESSFYALCIGKSTSAAARELLKGFGTLKILQSPKPDFSSVLEFALSLQGDF